MPPRICNQSFVVKQKALPECLQNPKKFGLTRVESLQASFHHFASKKQLSFIQQTVRLNQLLLNATSARSKQSFSSIYMNCTDKCIDSLQHFVYIINSRVNRVTKLAPNQVKKTDEAFLITLQNCNILQKPKFKIGQHVRIRRKIDLFHRGYRIQFTEEVFLIVAIETLNPPTYALKDSNEQLIRGKFYENELVRFEPDLS